MCRWSEETCFYQSQDQLTEPHTNCTTDVSGEMLNAIRNCYKLWLPCRVDEVMQHEQCAVTQVRVATGLNVPTTANSRCVNAFLVRNKQLHAITTSWWHWVQTSTAASWISSGLTGSPRAQVMDRFISALFGSGDSRKGRRFRTSSSPREGAAPLYSCMAFPYNEGTSKVGSSTPIPPRRD